MSKLGLTASSREQLGQLLRTGEPVLTPERAASALSMNRLQAAQQLARWAKAGWLARVRWIRAGERFDGRSHADGLVLSWHSDTGSHSRMLPYLCESTIGVAMSKVRRGLPQFAMRAFGSPLGDRC